MSRWRGSVGVLGTSALLALGCGGLAGPAPALQPISITTDACGNWAATIDAQGSGDVLAVDQDGVVVKNETIQGQQLVPISGTAQPGSTVTITARLGPAITTSAQAVMPPLDATIAITPTDPVFPAGGPGFVDATLTTACSVPALTMKAALHDANDPNHATAWTSQDLLTAAGSPTRVTLPAQRGLYDLVITASNDKGPLVEQRSRAYWGDASDDLDRDGATGGNAGDDCDDHDPKVGPLMAEQPVANGKDDDCDGTIDEGTTAFDDDGDGLSEDRGDCDDGDPGRLPGAVEKADCLDQDCDGTTDEGTKLVAADDPYEPDDTSGHAYDLQTSRQKAFSQEIVAVTRDANDDEWFKFFSQDGDWDAWGIDVVASGIPDGSVYRVELYGAGDTALDAMEVAAGSHDMLVRRGAMFRDDSGDYRLRIHPVKITQSWCPVRVTLTSF